MFVTIRQAISGVLTQIADDHLLVTNQPVTDQAQHARWFLNAIKTLQFSGLLVSNLSSQTQYIAPQFPNLEHIIAGTYVVNIDLAFRASETRNPNAHHQLVTDYFESQRSKKGKPLRLRDIDGQHMEPIRKRAELVTPAAWRGAPGQPAKVKTEIILYFVDKHELSDTHHRGILATYDVFAEEVTSTELVDFYRQNAFDMPGESRNNWANPDSWLIFGLEEYKDVVRHAARKEKRNRREWKRRAPNRHAETMKWEAVAAAELAEKVDGW
ncbi:hypothetical protein PMZ80_006123 [Knufia obscura]|uniref:Uncharacterized protein n=1 Tax=Knufia obscura TaxID=1635080 RepID=A0ABR0RPH1_9EURO|nr:hypothetical protein PMZ80_006123 [Knufia obscura]